MLLLLANACGVTNASTEIFSFCLARTQSWALVNQCGMVMCGMGRITSGLVPTSSLLLIMWHRASPLQGNRGGAACGRIIAYCCQLRTLSTVFFTHAACFHPYLPVVATTTSE